MRECGSCTLCCKLEKIPDFKPKNVWCQHCSVGVGCRIYADRPEACVKMRCVWLDDLSMSDDLRPDRVHLYAKEGDGYYDVVVDPDRPAAWREEGGAVVDHLLNKSHVIVQIGDWINFLSGHNVARPERVIIDWHL